MSLNLFNSISNPRIKAGAEIFTALTVIITTAFGVEAYFNSRYALADDFKTFKSGASIQLKRQEILLEKQRLQSRYQYIEDKDVEIQYKKDERKDTAVDRNMQVRYKNEMANIKGELGNIDANLRELDKRNLDVGVGMAVPVSATVTTQGNSR